MPSIFNLFVEHGRLCVITNGPLKGKLVTIVDIKDHRSALVDGPEDVTGVFRMVMNYNDLALTDIVVDITRGISSEDLAKALKEQDIIAKYNETPRAKRDASAEKRANLSDFERFRVRKLQAQKAQLVKVELDKLISSDKQERQEAYAAATRALKVHKGAVRRRNEAGKPRRLRKGI
mmetsp:Transcript_338/g.615  ORF Transcript_338/g.615 Transcript_338/m.615 type:complete len:177 (+) Transcript_338:59-589(+)|eukprot:CAMPEP_0117421630 /NCGR_PEP_ID=MMETSP0758-20121206/2660_1 /TAXON_ID=63605 /ORGANISM="Percolomonas cosmopolitus, Strain AE-1 (ATCC 50343)" /LENGTH=176 /DNA_ID=CAMNT_0005203823 /DNA_START=54 /DNA_END=584 /DNA_ORIENTATION=+